MPARLVSDSGEHVVIRPLAYVGEDEARLYCKEVACRLSAAAARRAAISACSVSA
jgi:tRNA(Ile)-lysidine synthase TilS/MesJ